MENNTTQQKPLYKVLNEKRTPTNWEVSKFKEGDFSLCKEDAGDMIAEGMKEPDAQYTALAVNNLHHLAEAIETVKSVLEKWDATTEQAKYRNLIFHLETAMNRIS